MIAFDLATGEVAWERQLGTPAAGSPQPLSGGGLLLTDSHAGVYKLSARPDSDVPTVDRVSDPLPRVTLHAQPQVFAVPAGDGKTVWVVANHSTPEGQKALVRKIVDGKQEVEGRATIPDRLAGTPTATAGAVFLPLANGYVYRIGENFTAVQGPSWRGQDANADSAVGHLLPAGPDQFFCTDGHTRVYRYKWKADQPMAEKAGGPWEVNEPITVAPKLLSAGGKILLLIPGGGEVCAFDPDRASPEPVRRWKGAANLKIAPERITHLAVIGQRAVFATEGKNVAGIDAEKDAAEWGLTDLPYPEAGDVIGVEPGDGVVYVTYSSGHVRVVTTATGAISGEVERAYGAPLAAAPAVPAGTPTRLIVANADGSVSVAPVLPRR
jgi:outer membrane protein assembly factor BamB